MESTVSSSYHGKIHTPKTLTGLPVVKGAWPLFGHIFPIMKDARSLLLDGTRELGNRFWIDLGFGNWTVVISGEAAHQVMQNKKTRSDIMEEFAGHIIGGSVLPADGAPHKRMRGAMNASFTPKGLSVARVGAMIAEIMETRAATWKEGVPLPIVRETSHIGLDVIFQMLGVPGDDLPLWHVQFSRYLNAGATIPIDLPGSPLRRSKQAKAWLDQAFSKLIERALETGEKETILGALTHGEDEKGRRLEQDKLLNNIRVLGLAGHETTASTMGWMMLHVADDHDLWEQIVEEATSQDQPPVSPKDLERFPKAEALFRECLRLYPPVGLLPPRRVVEPLEVEGFMIPPQTRVTASLLSLSMAPETYPEPDKIKLERWSGLGRKPRPSESIQFGGGPHFCLGYHLAVLEGALFIVYAAKVLAQRGLRPVLRGPIPSPQFGPIAISRPHHRARIYLEKVR